MTAAACSDTGKPLKRGYIDLQVDVVDWRGWRAVYSLAERAQMAGLQPDEALCIHMLKAVFGGEILDPAELEAQRLSPLPSAPQNDERPAPAAPQRRRSEPLVGQSTIAD